MNYQISKKSNCIIINLKGRITGGADSEPFSDEIHKLIDEGKKQIIINLEHVKFMNSSGLSIFIGGLNTVRKNDGDIKLCNANKQISSLLMVSQLNTVFDHFSSLDDALEAYKQNSSQS